MIGQETCCNIPQKDKILNYVTITKVTDVAVHLIYECATEEGSFTTIPEQYLSALQL